MTTVNYPSITLYQSGNKILDTGDIINNLTSTSTEDALSAYQGKVLNDRITNLPSPMVFKGTLGTGGTITSLPTASSANTGYVYKVITAGTYAGQYAKIGDMFISDGSVWVYVPSGDEPSGTVTNVAATGGTGISVSGSPITTSGTLTITNTGVTNLTAGNNVSISATTGNVTITATDTTYSNATTTVSGLMSTADKTKVDSYPTATTANNGQFLTVVSGVPAWTTVPSASEYTY